MEKKYIVSAIKKIISNGNTLEACNHIEYVLLRDTDRYDDYILIKNQLKNTLNESLLGIISQDNKQLRLNNVNHKLIEFLSSLKDHHFFKSINPLKSEKEILAELKTEHERSQFSIKQQEAILEMRLKEKNKKIVSLIKEHRRETLKLKNRIKQRDEQIEAKNLRIDELMKERERLRKIISDEYSKKKIWNKK